MNRRDTQPYYVLDGVCGHRVRHDSYDSARAEAERLNGLNRKRWVGAQGREAALGPDLDRPVPAKPYTVRAVECSYCYGFHVVGTDTVKEIVAGGNQ